VRSGAWTLCRGFIGQRARCVRCVAGPLQRARARLATCFPSRPGSARPLGCCDAAWARPQVGRLPEARGEALQGRRAAAAEVRRAGARGAAAGLGRRARAACSQGAPAAHARLSTAMGRRGRHLPRGAARRVARGLPPAWPPRSRARAEVRRSVLPAGAVLLPPGLSRGAARAQGALAHRRERLHGRARRPCLWAGSGLRVGPVRAPAPALLRSRACCVWPRGRASRKRSQALFDCDTSSRPCAACIFLGAASV